MKTTDEKACLRSAVLTPLAGAAALLLAVLLTLSLSQSHSLADPVSYPAVEKTVNTDQAGPGDTLTYTIHAWREGGTGAPIYGAWITDTLAGELEVTDLTATYGASGSAGGVITWTGDLGEVWITFTAQISPDITTATIVNTAEITGEGMLVESNPVTTEVSPGYLEALKTVSPEPARPGQQLLYTVYITNTGNGTVDSASMTDDLPPEVNWAGSLSASKGDWGVANDVITWTGTLAPSESVVIDFTADVSSTLSEETSFSNTVEVTGAGLPVYHSVTTTVHTTFTYYFPIVMRRFPPVPTLYSIPTPGDNNTYTVSWEDLNSPYVSHYVLQESTGSSFSSYTEWQTTGTSKSFNKGAVANTLYYRVRADGDSWGEGPWSNVRSVALGFYDNFSDDDSGWPDDKGEMYYDDDEGVWKYWKRGYKSGHYRFYIDQGGPFAWFYQPDALAPYTPISDKYCVETRLRFEKYGRWANMGLIFGANSSNSKLYSLCASYAGDGKVDWFVVLQDDYDFPKKACFGSYKQTIFRGTNVGDWVQVKVGVNGNNVDAYVNGVQRFSGSISGLGGMTKVGLSGGTYEVTPVDVRADYFKVTANVSCD